MWNTLYIEGLDIGGVKKSLQGGNGEKASTHMQPSMSLIQNSGTTEVHH